MNDKIKINTTNVAEKNKAGFSYLSRDNIVVCCLPRKAHFSISYLFTYERFSITCIYFVILFMHAGCDTRDIYLTE